MTEAPRTRAAARSIALALAAYATFIVYQSLAAGGRWACDEPMIGFAARISRTDLLANVLAYAPLGVLLALAIPRAAADGRSPARRTGFVVLAGTACVAALSAGVEAVQACQSARVSSAYDVIGNVAGGAAGILAGLALRTQGAVPLRGARAPGRTGSRLPWLTLAVVVAWIGSQALPWTFSVDVGTVRSNLSFLRRGPGLEALDGWRVLRHAGAWCAIGCAVRLLAADRRRWLVATGAALASAMLLQLVLDARAPLSLDELVGVAVGLAIVAVPAALIRTGAARPYPWAAGVFIGALASIAAYELQPGDGVARFPTFSVWPQVGLGGLRGALDYAMLFAWFGLASVVAARWAIRDVPRTWPAWWPAIAVTTTFALELAQMWMPGRGADLSAPILTLLAVLATRACLAVPSRDGV